MDSRDLLKRARAGLRPGPRAAEDGWGRLRARIADEDDVPELPRVPPTVEARRGGTIAVAAIVAIAAAIALWLAVGRGFFVGAEEERERQQAPDRIEPPATRDDAETRPEPAAPQGVDRPEIPAPFAEAEPPRVPAVRVPARKSAPSRARPAPVDDLQAELALLEAAKKALVARDPTRALDSLRAHARRFPTGALAEQRWAMHVRALCRLGRIDDAAHIAADFSAAHPSSPVAATLLRDPCAKKG